MTITIPARLVITREELLEHTIRHEYKGESDAMMANNGALVVRTGNRTGRSRQDRYIVAGVNDALIDWGPVNRRFDRQHFELLWDAAVEHAQSLSHSLFMQRLRVGADPDYAIRLAVYTKYAWHALFARSLFIRDPGVESMPEWTILNLPSFHTVPEKDGTNSDCSLFIDFDTQRILIAGLRYAGEMKKAAFSVMNFLAPQWDVLPMHCSANVGELGDVALFFGLSGTGKTTIGSDPIRAMLGDDEHLWSKAGIANIEGGCYAKCVGLTREREPVIWDAITAGAIIENVTLDDARNPDYDDVTLTENSRVAYPREHVANRDRQNLARHPSHIIFLTCDAYGVLPPVAILSPEQAVYHYLSGYTAQVGSTVVGGGSGITPKFSAFFGADFFPHKPEVYAELFERMIREHNVPVYLVNTGWTGGPYGHPDGRRYSIATSRAIVGAVLRGEVARGPVWHMDELNLDVPERVRGVETRHFRPREMWGDVADYDSTLAELVLKFHENFDRKYPAARDEIRSAGPKR